MLAELLHNHVLWTTIAAWAIAQLVKPALEYLHTRRWSWGLWFSSGGMPSSHSSLVCSAMLSVGLFGGFNTPVFALAVAITMVVVYDAAGVRREAGRHAEKINILIEEMFSGQPISEKQLKEVIGHTPVEVIAGVLLGFATAIVSFLIYGRA
jgi:acid phosphatase family membrane protein YuiD